MRLKNPTKPKRIKIFMRRKKMKLLTVLLCIHACIIACLSQTQTHLKEAGQIGNENREDILEQRRHNRIIMRILQIYKNNPRYFFYGAKKQRDRFIG